MLTLVARVSSLRRVHPPFYVLALLCLLLTAFFVVGIVLDPRYLTGAPLWLKPAKFAFSIAVYSLSMLWMLSFLEGRHGFVRFAGWWMLGVVVLELGVIAFQAARGLTSHFNFSDTTNALLFASMGMAISSLWLLHLVVTVLVLRQKLENPVLALSLRLGMVLTLLGLAEAFLMVLPTAGQMADLHAGGALRVIGAHSVGVPDGGAGLPVVGWSTQGGDLRIGHFIGIHALQVLPLLGWLLAFLPAFGNLLERQKVRLLWLVALGYLGVMLLVTLQALRGQSIVAPDTLTLALGGSLVILMVGAALWVLRGARESLTRTV